MKRLEKENESLWTSALQKTAIELASYAIRPVVPRLAALAGCQALDSKVGDIIMLALETTDDWKPYTGPFGGVGWINSLGKIIYGSKKPKFKTSTAGPGKGTTPTRPGGYSGSGQRYVGGSIIGDIDKHMAGELVLTTSVREQIRRLNREHDKKEVYDLCQSYGLSVVDTDSKTKMLQAVESMLLGTDVQEDEAEAVDE